MRKIIKTGISTFEIDEFCHNFIIASGGYPGVLNYHGFPKRLQNQRPVIATCARDCC